MSTRRRHRMSRIELEAYCKWITDKYTASDTKAKRLSEENSKLKERNDALIDENKKLKCDWKKTEQYIQMNETLKKLHEEKRKLIQLRNRLLVQLNTGNKKEGGSD